MNLVRTEGNYKFDQPVQELRKFLDTVPGACAVQVDGKDVKSVTVVPPEHDEKGNLIKQGTVRLSTKAEPAAAPEPAPEPAPDKG